MANISFQKIVSDAGWQQFLDLEKAAATCSPYYLAFTSIDEAKKYIGNSVVYLMFDDVRPVGHVEYEIQHEGTAEITGFVLSPDYRGQGLGKMLFGKAMDDLKNMKHIYLMAHPENSSALKIYLDAGFVIREWKDNFYGNGQPRLRLELNRA